MQLENFNIKDVLIPNRINDKEIFSAFVALIETVKQLKTAIVGDMSTLKEDVQSKVDTMFSELAGKMEKVSSTDTKWKDISTQLRSEIQGIKDLIPDMPEFPMDTIQSKLDDLDSKINTFSVDTPLEIRDKLESLTGENRIDISAIRGIGAANGKLTDEITKRAIGIVDQRTSYLINKSNNLQTQINNVSAIYSVMLGINMASASPIINNATTYIFCMPSSFFTTTSGIQGYMYFGHKGTIIAAYVTGYGSAKGGATSEASTLSVRLNNTTDYLISNAVTTYSPVATFSNTAMNIPVTNGDYIEIKWLTPTWVTKPTTVSISVTLIVTHTQ